MSPVSAHRAAWLVVLAGGVAALQVGKLPPALPALQAELGLTLVQSGFLLSMVQLAGMSLAVFMGLWADGMGLKRSMVRGLCLLALASGLGAFATSTAALLALRAIEGLGFLLVALPAPALIRRLVPPAQLSGMLGVWGAYMPTGTALALLAGPLFIPAWGWGAWWWLFAAVSLAMAAWLWRSVPADPVAHTACSWARRMAAPAPHLERPWPLACGPHLWHVFGPMVGGGGFLAVHLRRRWRGWCAAGCAHGLGGGRQHCGQYGFGPLAAARLGTPQHAVAGLWRHGAGQHRGLCALHRKPALAAFCRGAAVLGHGRFGAGHLVQLAVRLAPGEQQVATTVGWVQQLSALGQFVGPPVVAAVAARAGGWQLTPLVTVGCCGVGAVLAWLAGRLLPQAQSRP